MIEDKYYIEVFNHLQRIEGYNWFAIPAEWPNRQNIIEAIKKRIDMHGDFIFNDDYSQFKRVKPEKMMDHLTVEIHYFTDEEVKPSNYDHLPPYKPKAYDRKKFNQALGRT